MGMTGANLIGLEVRTYLLTAIAAPPGSIDFAAPNAAIVDIIRDETVNIETSLADVTDRRAGGWRLQRPTLKEGTIDLQMTYDTNSDQFNAFQDAFFNDTLLLMAFMDSNAAAIGAEGLVSAVRVTSFSMPRPLEDVVVVDATLTLDLTSGSTPVPPRWYTTTVTST